MGFGDRLKGLRDQAQQAVADNKDRIQGAVQVVGETANAKTHGKYATKIAKVGEKVGQSVDRFAAEGTAAGPDPAAPADAPGAPAAWEAPAEPAAWEAPAEPAAWEAPAEPAAPAAPAEPSAPPEFE